MNRGKGGGGEGVQVTLILQLFPPAGYLSLIKILSFPTPKGEGNKATRKIFNVLLFQKVSFDPRRCLRDFASLEPCIIWDLRIISHQDYSG